MDPKIQTIIHQLERISDVDCEFVGDKHTDGNESLLRAGMIVGRTQASPQMTPFIWPDEPEDRKYFTCSDDNYFPLTQRVRLTFRSINWRLVGIIAVQAVGMIATIFAAFIAIGGFNG